MAQDGLSDCMRILRCREQKLGMRAVRLKFERNARHVHNQQSHEPHGLLQDPKCHVRNSVETATLFWQNAEKAFIPTYPLQEKHSLTRTAVSTTKALIPTSTQVLPTERARDERAHRPEFCQGLQL